MSWSFISAGTAGYSTADDPTTFQPSLPTSYTTGDLLLLLLCNRDPTDPLVTAPSGYTLLGTDDAGSLTGGILIYGKIAVSASETAPAISFSSMSLCNYHMAAFRDSNGVTTLGSITHVLAKGDTASNANTTITYPAATITVDDCLVIIAGRKSKAISEASTVDAEAGFTEISEYRRAVASSQVSVWNYAIQTTAANITSGTWNFATGTWTEGSRDERALTLALLSSAASGSHKFVGKFGGKLRGKI